MAQQGNLLSGVILDVLKANLHSGMAQSTNSLLMSANLQRAQKLLRAAEFTEDELIDTLNTLMNQSMVTVKADARGEVVYELIDQSQRKEFSSMDFIEIEVYKQIEQSSDWGRSSKELRNELNKQMKALEQELVNASQLDKMLKKMEKEGKIKCWNSQQQDRKKVYLLSSQEPNSEIKGNQWEQGVENFDIMIDLMLKVYDHICHAMANGSPGKQLRELITYMKTEERDMSDDDLKRMIDVMIFDQKIELTQDNLYKAVNYQFPATLNCFMDDAMDGDDGSDFFQSTNRILFTEVPCSHCPLQNQCSATDKLMSVTPQKCLYFNIWEDQLSDGKTDKQKDDLMERKKEYEKMQRYSGNAQW